MKIDRKELTMKLRDGRKLGYAEYGKANGFPIVLFHGTPGSRLWFPEDDEVALSLSVRLIAVDRPGYGLSDTKHGRSILDWVDDVMELADHIHLDLFSVLGVSGGGAYAAACAYKIPHRLVSASMASSIAPFEKGKIPKAMCTPNRLAFFLSKNFPWLVKISFNAQKRLIEKDPFHYIEALQKQTRHLCRQDREVIQSKEYRQAFYLHMKEALRNGVDEAAKEPALLSKDWGFNLNEIKVPLHIWHGTEDTLAPVEEVKKLERLVPTSSATYIENAGHFMIEDSNTWKEILKKILHEKTRNEQALSYF